MYVYYLLHQLLLLDIEAQPAHYTVEQSHGTCCLEHLILCYLSFPPSIVYLFVMISINIDVFSCFFGVSLFFGFFLSFF